MVLLPTSGEGQYPIGQARSQLALDRYGSPILLAWAEEKKDSGEEHVQISREEKIRYPLRPSKSPTYLPRKCCDSHHTKSIASGSCNSPKAGE